MKQLKFIDLFAGIGGFRLAFEDNGAKCVFSCEIEPHAIEMYKKNFGDDPTCDITKLKADNIPDFDILCAGFPCQAFSISGKQKGFQDAARGTLFFDIYRILKEKKPCAFILENVQNLEKHNHGKTLYVIINSLNQIGYSVSYKVLNAKDYGVPQNRERIIIIGNKYGRLFDFQRLQTTRIVSMLDFLDTEGDFEFLPQNEYILLDENNIKRQKKSGLIFAGYRKKKIRTAGTRENTYHLSRVHKQPNRIYSSLGIHPTIASQEQSGRYFILIENKVRKLTLNECYRFMGFPEKIKKIGSKAKQYERIGNSVCVPMIKEIAKEMIKQFFTERDKEMTPQELLEDIYKKALTYDKGNTPLNNTQIENIKNIVEKEETFKGVFTVLISSLTYKILYPSQDVRLHKKEMENGYSGRGFDTKNVTPFLKQKQFRGAMKESGWLTRSLEQAMPFDFDFKGKINSPKVKKSFLEILNDVEEKKANALDYLLMIFHLSIKEKEKNTINIINPVISEAKITINDIIELLDKHFNYKYTSRGASILPVIALFSAYECIIGEIKRFETKKLQPIASHYSCDKNSKNAGDIVVIDDRGDLYEVVEVKFNIAPDLIMLQDAYNKIKETTIQRYYILSTKSPKINELADIENKIEEIKREHGCQVIVNGVMQTLKYYLRLLKDTDIFVEKYTKNLKNHPEINYEHKISWNNISLNK